MGSIFTRGLILHRFEEAGEEAVSFHGMAEWFLGMNRVVVSPPVTSASQVSGFAKVRDDTLDCSLGNADANSDVTGPD